MDAPIAFIKVSAKAARKDEMNLHVTQEDIRKVGGIIHRDGNIFFTNIEKLNAAIQHHIDSRRAELRVLLELELDKETQRWLTDNPNTSDIAEFIRSYSIGYGQQCAEIATLKAALRHYAAITRELEASQKQEPVAWLNPTNGAVVDTRKKTQIGVGDGYPNFSVALIPVVPVSPSQYGSQELQDLILAKLTAASQPQDVNAGLVKAFTDADEALLRQIDIPGT